MRDDGESVPQNNADEIEISEGDSSGYSEQDILEKTIEIIEQERKDIRTIIQSSLSISGLLLTISLGVIYFGYSNNSTIVPPTSTKVLLFMSSSLLTASIFINILALRLKPIRPIETDDRAISLREAYDNEKWYTSWSTIALLLSILGLFFAMGAFAWDRADHAGQLCMIKDAISLRI